MTPRARCRGWAASPVAFAALSCLLSGCTRQNPAYWASLDTDRDAQNNGLPPGLDARAQSPDGARGDAVQKGLDAPSSTPLDSGLVTAIQLTGSNLTGRYGKYYSIHDELCPDNQVLGGYTGTVGVNGGPPVVSGLDAECREIVVGPGQPPAVTLEAGATLTPLGARGTTFFTARCPPNEAVVAFEGRNGLFLDQLVIKCAPLSITSQGAVSIGPWTSLPPQGGTGGSVFQDACGTGQIARGHSISTSTAIDGFGLICGTPMVAP